MPDFRNEIERRRTFAIISHPDAGKTTLLLKTGGTFYTAEVPHDQTSGELTAVTRFSINTTGVSLTTGAVLDVTGWTWQDCGYHDGRLYVPVCKGASTVVGLATIARDKFPHGQLIHKGERLPW